MANTPNYMEQGGARQVVGGSLDVVSGGEIDIESGGALKLAGTAITATAAEINAAVVPGAIGSITVTVAGGAEHECDATIQLNDAAGSPLTGLGPFQIFVWLSDLADGTGGSAHTHSTGPAFTTGAIQQIMIATDAWVVLTDVDGKAVLHLVDTADENVTVNASSGAVRGSDTTVAGDWAA